MDMMRRSTLSTPLTMEFVKPNRLKFIPQKPPGTHYLPRYLIPKFPLERIKVNAWLHWCDEARFDVSRTSGGGAMMRPFLKGSREAMPSALPSPSSMAIAKTLVADERGPIDGVRRAV